jgi:hypothetical protein
MIVTKLYLREILLFETKVHNDKTELTTVDCKYVKSAW